MVVDQLANASRYVSLHPGFASAVQFAAREDLEQLANGRHEIDGQRLYVMISREQGRGRERSLLEVHRRYIDIQLVIGGEDCIGWLPNDKCQRISSAYDAQKDLQLYFDRPPTWLVLPTDTFAIFFPEDAHAPLANDSLIHKAVFKIAVDW